MDDGAQRLPPARAGRARARAGRTAGPPPPRSRASRPPGRRRRRTASTGRQAYAAAAGLADSRLRRGLATRRSRQGWPVPQQPVPDNGPAVAGFVLSLVAGGLLLISRRPLVDRLGRLRGRGHGLLRARACGASTRARPPSTAASRRPASGSASSALVLSVLATLAWIAGPRRWRSRTRSSETTSSASSTTPRAPRRSPRPPWGRASSARLRRSLSSPVRWRIRT